MYKILIAIFIVSNFAFANFVETNVKEFKWGELDVVWVKDSKYPTYDIVVYFDDGALTENKSNLGVTEFMFNELTSGTNRYNQKQILSSLEFYGTSFSANVTHEFSTYSLSGLVKDLSPNLKMVCHLFNNATFPKSELKKSKRRAVAGLKSLVTNHQSLANRVFRELSLRGTPYSKPVSGTIETIKKLSSKKLSSRLEYFNQVKKKIYIRGPESVLDIKNMIVNDCSWTKNTGAQKRIVKEVKTKAIDTKSIYLVSVPKANQAQIRMGKVLTAKEATKDQVRLSFASKYLGGGFTSRLMQEVRVKKGLTYSIGAYASGQRNYGRSGISTFTKNQTLVETLNVIKATIDSNIKNIPDDLFNHSLRYIKGNYLLGMESTSDFMNTLLYLDHQGRPYSDIYDFTEEISTISTKSLSEKIKEIYDFKSQMVLVLGSSKLRAQLKKAGYKVKRISYKEFL